MKRIFLLFILMGTSANAATMCAPDLSTCESCTDFDDVGMLFWSANCCGVPVSGWWVGYRKNNRSVDVNSLYVNDLDTSTGAMGYNLCVMMNPFVAPYAVNVKHTVLASSYVCGAFIPKCAVTYCDETVPETSGDWF